MGRHGRRHVVGVECAVGEAVHQLDDIAVLDAVDRLLDDQILAVRPLDDPPVVNVLESVAGDLLLVRGTPPIRIPGITIRLVFREPFVEKEKVSLDFLANLVPDPFAKLL